MYRPPLTMAPRRAERPIAPRIASGVPAAMPQAPATMITEIVERVSRVMMNVSRGRSECEIDQITGYLIRQALHRGTRPFGAFDQLDDFPVAGVTAYALRSDLERTGLVDRASKHCRARPLLSGHRFSVDWGLIDERMTSNDFAVDGDAPAGVHHDDVADRQLFDGHLANLSVAADRDRPWQVVQEIADSSPSARHGHVFQDFSDQDEQGNDQRGEEFGDGGRGDDGDAHGELHRHASGDDVLGGFPENWPATDQEAQQPKHAHLWKRLPDAEANSQGG